MLDYASFPEQRQSELVTRLQREGKLVCSQLASELGVSEHTIRRDIVELANRGLCKKVYGGAIEISPAQGSILTRTSNIGHEKQRIAEGALKLIAPNSTVYLDSGTTSLAVVQSMPRNMDITLITNSIPLAHEALSLTKAEVILLGGKVEKSVGGSVGAEAQEQLRKLYIDIGFLGVCAFDTTRGISSFNYDDALFKRLLVKQCGQLVAPVTGEKYATIARHHVAEVNDISDIIVCKDKMSQEQQNALAQTDITVNYV